MKVESDHGNDSFSPKSASSQIGFVAAPSVRLLCTFGCKGQTAEARNTAEAETVALDYGTFRAGLPLAAVLEQIFMRRVRLIAFTDNEACLQAVKKGHSRRLGYLKKHQRVSLAALRRIYVGAEEHEDFGLRSDNSLEKEASKENEADLGTKPLESSEHHYLLHKAGMVSLLVFRQSRL